MDDIRKEFLKYLYKEHPNQFEQLIPEDFALRYLQAVSMDQILREAEIDANSNRAEKVSFRKRVMEKAEQFNKGKLNQCSEKELIYQFLNSSDVIVKKQERIVNITLQPAPIIEQKQIKIVKSAKQELKSEEIPIKKLIDLHIPSIEQEYK